MKFKVDVATLATQLDALSTLIKAATAADAVDTLLALNPLTIFAPDNAAFSKVPAGTLDSLLNNKEHLNRCLRIMWCLGGTSRPT